MAEDFYVYKGPVTQPQSIFEPTTPEQQAALNAAVPESVHQNQSFDDATQNPFNKQQTNNPTSITNSAAGTQTDAIDNDRAGTTISGKKGVDVVNQPGNSQEGFPGARTFNPLTKFASYNYAITLYLCTPEARDQFWLEGGATIPEEGMYVICQSGGIDNKNSNRAPYFDLDVYIDELVVKSPVAFVETMSANLSNDFSFTITEPFGFSFPTRINKLGALLIEKSNIAGIKTAENILQLPFIVGVRFYGFGADGKPLTSVDLPQQGIKGNASTDVSGVFEKFYDIKIKTFKFKLDGRATKYFITAASFDSQAGLGIKHGLVNNGGTLQGKTIKDVLLGKNGLRDLLNSEQKEEVKAGTRSEGCDNEYDFTFLPDDDSSIPNASIISASDLDKTKYSVNPIQNSDGDDEANRNPKPDPEKQNFIVNKGTPILKVINNIISQSTYLEAALKVLYGTTDDESGDNDTVKKDTKSPVRWYCVIPQVAIKSFDKKLKDWCYKINYIIKPYETPYVRSSYAAATSDYYGPVKIYDYWWTGKNTEVISFEQQIDQLFMNIVSVGGLGESDQGLIDDLVPTVPNMPQPYVSKEGRFDISKEAQNSYVTSLYSPNDFVTSKLKIMGDPDYLIPSPQGIGDYLSLNDTRKRGIFSRFYARDGVTVSPSGGQVFIEIRFNQADDYNANTGLLNVNNRVVFFSKNGLAPQRGGGISFLVSNIIHSFSLGKFTQELTLKLNTQVEKRKKKIQENESQAETQRLQRQAQTDTRTPQGTDDTTVSGDNGKTVESDMKQTAPYSAGSSETSVSYGPQTLKPTVANQVVTSVPTTRAVTDAPGSGSVADDDNSSRGPVITSVPTAE